MIAIFTKYIGPSNVKGSRVKAYCMVKRVINGSVILEWDSGLSAEENHARAAKALAIKCAWFGNWYQGDAGDEYVFVRVPAHELSLTDAHASFFIKYDRDAEQKRIDLIMAS